MNHVDELKKISITSYLESRGITPDRKQGNLTIFSSPFNRDSTPSFMVYEDTNTFNDFSSGIGGDIINLVQTLEKIDFNDALIHLANGSLLPIIRLNKTQKKNFSSFKGFNADKFVVKNEVDEASIRSYARGRKIFSNFLPCEFYVKLKDGSFAKKLGMGFVHQDEDLDVCGIKFRDIDPSNKQRFSARGRMCFYVLENIIDGQNTTLYITESETSSNSLYTILKSIGKSFVILCVGGSTNYPERIPDKYSHIKDRKIIIDFDGGKDYKEKMERFSLFGDPVTIELDKGQDINSLLCEGNEQIVIEKCYG